jgi:hypothetical protein
MTVAYFRVWEARQAALLRPFSCTHEHCGASTLDIWTQLLLCWKRSIKLHLRCKPSRAARAHAEVRFDPVSEACVMQSAATIAGIVFGHGAATP